MKTMSEMSKEDLRKAARDYDRVQNEGGEGYNPYWAELDRRAAAEEAARPKTRGERKSELIHQLSVLDCSIARESGTYDEAKCQAIRDEIAKIEAEEEAEFLTEWTLEETKQRRADWNARVRAGEFTLPNGKADMAKVYEAEQAQGWGRQEMKKAIKIHNL